MSMVNGCVLMSFLCTKHPVCQTSIKWIYHHASYTSRSTPRYMEISMHIPSMFFSPTCQARVVRFYASSSSLSFSSSAGPKLQALDRSVSRRTSSTKDLRRYTRQNARKNAMVYARYICQKECHKIWHISVLQWDLQLRVCARIRDALKCHGVDHSQ